MWRETLFSVITVYLTVVLATDEPEYIMVMGSGYFGGLYSASERIGETQCCGLLTECYRRDTDDNLTCFSGMNSDTKVTWYEADKFCRDRSLRLCTYLEVEAGNCRGMGCGHDGALTWTSSTSFGCDQYSNQLDCEITKCVWQDSTCISRLEQDDICERDIYIGNTFTVTSFSVNGKCADTYHFTPDQAISVHLEWENAEEACTGCIEQLYIGIQGEPFDCIYSGNSSYFLRGDHELDLTGLQPGEYTIGVTATWQYNCIARTNGAYLLTIVVDEPGEEPGDDGQWMMRSLVAEQGFGIDGHAGGRNAKTLAECQEWCDATPKCRSIAWREDGDCWLKEKCVTEDDPAHTGDAYRFNTYYKDCANDGPAPCSDVEEEALTQCTVDLAEANIDLAEALTEIDGLKAQLQEPTDETDGLPYSEFKNFVKQLESGDDCGEFGGRWKKGRCKPPKESKVKCAHMASEDFCSRANGCAFVNDSCDDAPLFA